MMVDQTFPSFIRNSHHHSFRPVPVIGVPPPVRDGPKGPQFVRKHGSERRQVLDSPDCSSEL